MTATVNDIIRRKGSKVVTVLQDVPVYQALGIMKEKKIGALIVTDNGGKAVGIVSDRDCTQKIILEERPAKTTPVAKIMTRNLIRTTPDKTAEDCLTVMLEERVRHLPVFDGDKIAGLVSIGDAVKSIVKKQRVEIKHLNNYIAGNYV
jgi:CBS domain-containing protein